METRYVMRSIDGSMVTYDTRYGASLTKSSTLCFVWKSREKAEAELAAYEAILGVPLSVGTF